MFQINRRITENQPQYQFAGYRIWMLQLTSRTRILQVDFTYRNTSTVFTEYQPQCPFAGYRNNILYNFVVQTVNRTPVLYCIDFGMTDNRISVLLYCNDEFSRLIFLLLDNLLNLLSCCFVSVYRVGKCWFASHLDYSTASNNNNISRGTDIPTCVGFLLRLTHVDFLWPMKYLLVRFHVVIDTHACNV